MNNKQLLGSSTAKAGFQNEKDIVKKFNGWKEDIEARKWLSIMGYQIKDIEYVKAIIISGQKTDVQVQITIKLKNVIDVQNLQVKLVSNEKGFNQVDKRWVDQYVELWGIPKDLSNLLKLYCGEIEPKVKNPKDKRRTFADEFTTRQQGKLINWLEVHKGLIVCDIIKGRGQFAAEWMLVAQKSSVSSRWILKSINQCINHYMQGPVEVTPRGSIRIGNITMQRKGGDGGRKTACMLQFKLNPAEVFDI